MITLAQPILAVGAPAGLSPAGAAIMIASITIVCALLAFCIVMILREPHPEEHHHAPLDIDTRDAEP